MIWHYLLSIKEQLPFLLTVTPKPRVLTLYFCQTSITRSTQATEEMQK